MTRATTSLFAFLACCVLLGPLPRPTSADPNDMFLTRSTAKTPEAVVEAIKAYTDAKKWLYLGANKVKQGEVTLVKICIPEVGKQIWPVGLHLSAMLPCGNLGVYQKGGSTEISLLHARYTQVLYPLQHAQSREPMAGCATASGRKLCHEPRASHSVCRQREWHAHPGADPQAFVRI